MGVWCPPLNPSPESPRDESIRAAASLREGNIGPSVGQCPSVLQILSLTKTTRSQALAEDIATELARALQLPGTNRTLGRKFVGFGLSALRDYSSDAEAEGAFLKKSRSLASIRPELANGLLHRVRERLRNATLQVTAEREEAAVGAKRGALAGFSALNGETLRGGTGAPSGGGVIKASRERPASSRRPAAALGLEDLAAWKRAERAGVHPDSAKEDPASSDASTHGGGGAARPERSGIGVDRDAWDRPVRLDSSKTTASEHFWNRGGTPGSAPSTSSTVAAARVGFRVWTPSWRDEPTTRCEASAGGASPRDRGAASSSSGEEDGEEEWAAATPRAAARRGVDEDFDRRYYDDGLEAGGGTAGDGEAPFVGNEAVWEAREAAMARQRAKGERHAGSAPAAAAGGAATPAGQGKVAGLSARRSQLHADQAAWEENRLLTSGVASEREVELDFDDEAEARCTLLVHQLRPPFLDGRVAFTTQQDMVPTVRDATSDMATNARNGSARPAVRAPPTRRRAARRLAPPRRRRSSGPCDRRASGARCDTASGSSAGAAWAMRSRAAIRDAASAWRRPPGSFHAMRASAARRAPTRSTTTVRTARSGVPEREGRSLGSGLAHLSSRPRGRSWSSGGAFPYAASGMRCSRSSVTTRS